MIVFRQYLKVIWKIKSIFIAFIIFLFFSSFFALKSGETSISKEVNHYKFAVIDRDNSTLSKNLVAFIGEKAKPVTIKKDKLAIKDNLFYRNIHVVIVIPKGFEKNCDNSDISIERYSSPNAWASFYFNSHINNYMNFRKQYRENFPDFSEGRINRMLKEDLSYETEVKSMERDRETGLRKGFTAYFRFMGYVLLYEILGGIGIASVAFNKEQVRRRIMCSSLKESEINKGMMLGHLFLTLLVIAMPLLTTFFLFPLSIIFSATAGLMTMRLIVHTLTIVAMAMLLTVLTNKISTVSIISNAVSLPMCFLGGIFIPLELLSPKILKISQFLPQYWFSKGISAVSGRVITRADYSEFLKGIGMEFIMIGAILLLALGINWQKRILRL